MPFTENTASFVTRGGPVHVRDKRSDQGRTQERWLLAVVVALALAYVAHRWHADFGGLEPFWDAHVYLRGYHAWRAGLSPYVQGETSRPENWLPFVSPPVFLYLMRAFGTPFPGQTGLQGYGVLVLVCTLATPVLLAHFYLQSRWLTPAVALLVTWFQPGHFGSQALLTGNLSNVLYAALLLAGVPGIRRGRWLPFYVAVVFAGAMKPPFLAFLLLPLLAGSGQWLGCAATVVAVAGVDALQASLAPQLWKAFQAAVYRRVFAEGDAGFGLLAQWTAAQHHLQMLRAVPSGVAAVIVVGLLTASLFYVRRRFGKDRRMHLWLPCIVVLCVLANPRLLAYDVVVGCAPALYLIVECIRLCRPGPLRALGVAAGVLAWLGAEHARPEQGVFFLLLVSVLLTIVALLWPSEVFRSSPEPR